MAQTEIWDRKNQRGLSLWLPMIVVVLIIVRAISSRWPVKSSEDLVKWVPIEQAARASEVSKKPILYEFSAEWCGPCHVMEDEIFRDSTLAALINERFVPVKVVDRQRETGANPPPVSRLQSLYAVNAFPTIVVEQRGKEPAKVVGYEGKTRFEQFLRGIH